MMNAGKNSSVLRTSAAILMPALRSKFLATSVTRLILTCSASAGHDNGSAQVYAPRMTRRILGLALAVVWSAVAAGAAGTLDIYFIDVEGGQSTLIVTPAGESLLVDAGWSGVGARDADRIAAAAKAAGIKRIDYLVVTHFHSDNAGGVPELAKQLPIHTFVDHDTIVPTDTNSAPIFNAYKPVREAGSHIAPEPGDPLPLKGVNVRIVSTSGRIITAPAEGDGRANAACSPPPPAPGEATENPRSTGIHVQYGRFRFIDLGDLSGQPLFDLVCPKNLLGKADVYLVPHHGGADVVYPATFVVSPRVAIMNNGERKGGAPQAFAEMRRVPGLEDVWQIHKSRASGAENFADDRIANLDETTAHWIKVSANENGTFTVTNGRTGATKSYR